jgi:hypothetical protein
VEYPTLLLSGECLMVAANIFSPSLSVNPSLLRHPSLLRDSVNPSLLRRDGISSLHPSLFPPLQAPTSPTQRQTLPSHLFFLWVSLSFILLCCQHLRVRTARINSQLLILFPKSGSHVHPCVCAPSHQPSFEWDRCNAPFPRPSFFSHGNLSATQTCP